MIVVPDASPGVRRDLIKHKIPGRLVSVQDCLLQLSQHLVSTYVSSYGNSQRLCVLLCLPRWI